MVDRKVYSSPVRKITHPSILSIPVQTTTSPPITAPPTAPHPADPPSCSAPKPAALTARASASDHQSRTGRPAAHGSRSPDARPKINRSNAAQHNRHNNFPSLTTGSHAKHHPPQSAPHPATPHVANCSTHTAAGTQVRPAPETPPDVSAAAPPSPRNSSLTPQTARSQPEPRYATRRRQSYV